MPNSDDFWSDPVVLAGGLEVLGGVLPQAPIDHPKPLVRAIGTQALATVCGTTPQVIETAYQAVDILDTLFGLSDD